MKRIAAARKTAVNVAVGEPIPAAGAKVSALADPARAEVQELVLQARGLSGFDAGLTGT